MECKISVIIPVYNTEQYLCDCLKSVINQTLQEIEILCIDDGSTDESLAVLQSWEIKDNRIRILCNDFNQGLSAARNRGIENAVGDYIYFLDSDDMLLKPEALEELYYIAEEKSTDIIFFNQMKLYESGEMRRQGEHIVYTADVVDGRALLAEFVRQNDLNVMVHEQFYSKRLIDCNCLRFREGILHEDILFTIYAISSANRVICIPKFLYGYRHRMKSITTEMSDIALLKRIYGYCITVKELSEYICHCKDDDLKKSIEEVIVQKIAARVGKCYREIDVIEETYFQQYYHDLTFLRIVIAGFYNGFFPEKLHREHMKKLRDAKSIYIYGAGQKGQGLYLLLRERNIRIAGFVVTQKDAVEYDLEKPVFELRELADCTEDILLIIAVVKHNEEMQRYAEQLGFRNIIIS